MSSEKSERLLNLLIMLLVQRRYVAKDRIRDILYPDSSVDAFEKMFERDKEELRSLGVPIEVGQMDAYFDDEPGYRVRADELTLPDISEAPNGPVVISLPAVRCTPAVLDQLREVLGAHPGMTEVQVRLMKPQGTLVARLPRHRVTPSQPLMADLKALLGPSCLAS